MTDDAAAEPEIESEETRADVQRVTDRTADPKLRTLVMYLEIADQQRTSDDAAPSTFNVTFTTSGGLVGGRMVPERWWQERLLEGTAASHQGTADAWRSLFETIDGFDQDVADEERFVHLENAVFVFGANDLAPVEGGFLWRGRLSEIAGWSMGVLSVA